MAPNFSNYAKKATTEWYDFSNVFQNVKFPFGNRGLWPDLPSLLGEISVLLLGDFGSQYFSLQSTHFGTLEAGQGHTFYQLYLVLLMSSMAWVKSCYSEN